jgi:hypothetical protein
MKKTFCSNGKRISMTKGLLKFLANDRDDLVTIHESGEVNLMKGLNRNT